MARKTVRGNKETDGGLGIEDPAAPRNDGNKSAELFPGVAGADGKTGVDPAELAGEAADASDEPRKRRGRGPGRAKRTAADQKTGADNITRLLYALHVGIAKLTETPEMELTEPEAETLGGAVYGVASLYKPSWLTEEAEAWGNLIIVCAAVYGPRLIAARSRKDREKDAPRATIQ